MASHRSKGKAGGSKSPAISGITDEQLAAQIEDALKDYVRKDELSEQIEEFFFSNEKEFGWK